MGATVDSALLSGVDRVLCQVKSYPTLIMFDNEKKLKHVCKKRKEVDIRKFIDQFLVAVPRDEL